MANKILISKGDVNDFYEPSGSEDEYTEHERSLLRKVRNGRHRDGQAELEILAFDQNYKEDEDDSNNYGDDNDGGDFDKKFEADSDVDAANNYDGIPDPRAWGKKRRDFYSTDFVDQDYSSYNTREEELADQEESEARAIQKRLAKQLEETDFSLDLFSLAKSSKGDSKKDKKDEIYLKKDLSQLTQRQREQLFIKDSPEFEGLVQDFKHRLSESLLFLEPAITYFTKNHITNQPLVEFIVNQNQLVLNYCTNVSFYLVLKAKRISIKNHPIIKRLVQIRQLLLQTQSKYTNIIKPQLEQLLAAMREGREFKIVVDEVVKDKQRKKFRFVDAIENTNDDSKNAAVEQNNDDDDMEFKRTLKTIQSESDPEKEDGEHGEDGNDYERRQITYQMAKNKGLTPYRKKDLRNPRVKHRNKFRKALIRRKGAVRTVRKEIKRYDGEKFGIKATAKKGIKIK